MEGKTRGLEAFDLALDDGEVGVGLAEGDDFFVVLRRGLSR